MNDPRPDIETASPDYASRFVGKAGEFMLSVQSDCVARPLKSYSGGTLLDVGGGHGQLVGLYDELEFAYTVHGSDDACFKYALADLPEQRKVVSDLRDLPFDDASIDVVVAVRLITHLDDWPRVLREMCRVARKAVVIDYPTKRSLNALTPLLFRMKKNIEGNTRTYTNFSAGDFRDSFDAAGFRIDSIVNQFFLPMVIHRMLKGQGIGRFAEKIARVIGLTWALGSPAIARAIRPDVPSAEAHGLDENTPKEGAG